jgi:hypothetical protein
MPGFDRVHAGAFLRHDGRDRYDSNSFLDESARRESVDGCIGSMEHRRDDM